LAEEHIRALPPLPAQLQHLHMSGFKHLRSLPALPFTLQTLHCIGCAALKANFSSTAVKELSCYGCVQLQRLPDLPESLQDLKIEGSPSLAEVRQ
jgi:hypothetical protein